jgi:hypothetical protein
MGAPVLQGFVICQFDLQIQFNGCFDAETGFTPLS